MADRVEVRVEGVRELRRDLGRLEDKAPDEIREVEEKAAKRAANEAGRRAVRLTGEYARSIVADGSSVGSVLPQAGVLHFGGTIRPRGVPIRFPARPVISEALERRESEIVDEFGDAIERAARHAGW